MEIELKLMEYLNIIVMKNGRIQYYALNQFPLKIKEQEYFASFFLLEKCFV